MSPSGPVSTSPSVHASAARAPASASASAMRVTPWARACAISVSHERSALRPTSSMSRERSTMSSACVPIEPVEPRMSSRRATPLGCHSRRQCRVNPVAESPQTPVDPQHAARHAHGVGRIDVNNHRSIRPTPSGRAGGAGDEAVGSRVACAAARARRGPRRRSTTGSARAGCTWCTAASTRSATARCAPKGGGSRRCSPAGPAPCSAIAAPPRTGGCSRRTSRVIDVTAPRSRDGVPGIRLHRSRSLDARDTTTHEGIPITTIARTLLDLAATAEATASSERSPRPSASSSTTTARSPTS